MMLMMLASRLVKCAQTTWGSWCSKRLEHQGLEGRKGAPMMLMMLASRLVKCAQPLGGVGAASVWSTRVWRAGKEPR